MFFKTIAILFLVGDVMIIRETVACNGYSARIVRVDNCAGPNAIITLDPNFTVRLTQQCELVSEGCVTNKAFKTAVTKYKVQKDGVVLRQGQMDLCSAAGRAPAEVENALKLFGAPSKCPVAAGRVCGNGNKIDLSKYRGFLTLARGYIVLDSEIDHDVGKSCFHVEMQVTRN